jgi:hypothetical protein
VEIPNSGLLWRNQAASEGDGKAGLAWPLNPLPTPQCVLEFIRGHASITLPKEKVKKLNPQYHRIKIL